MISLPKRLNRVVVLKEDPDWKTIGDPLRGVSPPVVGGVYTLVSLHPHPATGAWAAEFLEMPRHAWMILDKDSLPNFEFVGRA